VVALGDPAVIRAPLAALDVGGITIYDVDGKLVEA
jgi:hypothetical protein